MADVRRDRKGAFVGLALAAVMFLWVFAFAPAPVALATVPGVVAFLAIVERAPSTKRAILWLVLFGAVAIGFGYRWLAQTIQHFGGVPVVPSYLLVALFGVVGTVHGWIFIPLYRSTLGRTKRPHPLLTVCLIVAVETLPIRLFGWMAGHGAVDVAPLLQSAAWGGVAGVSFALLCLVVPVHEWLRWAFATTGAPARPRAALLTFLVGVGLYVWGLFAYGAVREAERDASEGLRVGIVQADIGSFDKRRAEQGRKPFRQLSIEAYERGTREAVEAGAELIVWPETAITDSVPLFRKASSVDGYLSQRGYAFLRELGRERAFLIGLYERLRPPENPFGSRRDLLGTDRRYNVAALRQPGGRDAPWTSYRKVYLIPFGEFMPLGLPTEFLPQSFEMAVGDDDQGPLRLGDLRIVPFLCYEGILPGHVRDVAGEERPDLLASLTNDSWFGDTWEPHQHLAFTRFRAVEHRAPLVRATNTGISAFVSASGDVVSSLALDREGVLVETVPLVEREPSLYARVGHRFPWLLYAFSALGLLIAWSRRRVG